MKIVSVILIVLLVCSCKKDINFCDESGGSFVAPEIIGYEEIYNSAFFDTVYHNRLVLNSQKAVDSFACFRYNMIKGDVIIQPGVFSEINSLESLCSLKEITGDLILENLYLEDLIGLQNLKRIGGELLIKECNGLKNLSKLTSLQEIDLKLLIINNSSLEDISSLNILSGRLNTINISRNKVLKSIPKWDNLKTSNYFVLANDNLYDLDLSNILDSDIFNFLYIAGNKNLSNIESLDTNSGFSSLWIYKNDKIANLDFMLGHKINSVLIFENKSLNDFCGLDLSNIQFSNNIEIFDNLFNPTFSDLQNGYCRP